MKPALIILLGFLAVGAFGQNSVPRSLVYTIQGSYTSTFNSHGTVASWSLYSDGSMDSRWVTDRGNIQISTKGDLKIQELATGAGTQYYLVFRAAGQVILPNGVTVPCSLMGKGLFGGRSLTGDYILLIDNDDINSDFGQFSGEVTRKN